MFSLLQLSSGFVGADSFHFSYAGTLLAYNTFGGEILGLLVLLAILSITSNIDSYSNKTDRFDDVIVSVVDVNTNELKSQNWDTTSSEVEGHYETSKIDTTKNENTQIKIRKVIEADALRNNMKTDSNDVKLNRKVLNLQGNVIIDRNNTDDAKLIDGRSSLELAFWVCLLIRLSLAFGSMLAATVLRRHLMVWAIFAPKVSTVCFYIY